MEIMPRLMALPKLHGINYFLEFISILNELAISKDQTLLSTQFSEMNDFQNSESIKKVYEFIQENYHRKIALEEISQLVNMSAVSFNRFKKKEREKPLSITSMTPGSAMPADRLLNLKKVLVKSVSNVDLTIMRISIASLKDVKNARQVNSGKNLSACKEYSKRCFSGEKNTHPQILTPSEVRWSLVRRSDLRASPPRG